jgi:flagellar hook protein FlgE
MAVGSFSAGLSGLNANAQALNVIGNNLANINTVGFKASSITFEDLVSQNIDGSGMDPSQVGLGVGVGQVSPVFSQGTIENSHVATNVAIQGNGFFVLNGPQGMSYTRAGNFTFNNDGMLVTPDGQFVQGYTATDPATGKIVTNGQPTNITIPPGVLRPPTATTAFSTLTNLNADAATGDTFTSSIQIYDSLGAAHITTMTFTKTGPGAWSYALTANGDEVSGGTPGTPFQIATGTLTFDGTGALSAVNGGAVANVSISTPAWANGAPAGTMNWQLLDANNKPDITSFAAASATSSVTQNGSAAGTVTDVSINSKGEIIATIGAGGGVTIGQLALVSFNNPAGLVKLGGNRYGESAAAGLQSLGVAGTGGRGTLIGSALEQSNVDMAEEFTKMILAQRGYQANSKTITVSDQLIVDTLNLKQ